MIYGCGHNVDTMTYNNVTNHMSHPLATQDDAAIKKTVKYGKFKLISSIIACTRGNR